LKLAESDPSLSTLCRAVEVRVQSVHELAGLELPVVLLRNFDSVPELSSFPEGKVRDAYRLSPAMYQAQTQRVLVNAAGFFSLPRDIAEAVLAHEVGHAVCHRDSIMAQPRYRPLLCECIVADLLACKWGFFEGLRNERLERYGLAYCKVLELWSNEDEFLTCMTRWHLNVLSGGSQKT